ncbi:MAG: SGNH/GDSL hydrolase family protein [Desulfomonilaceae bacterium]
MENIQVGKLRNSPLIGASSIKLLGTFILIFLTFALNIAVFLIAYNNSDFGKIIFFGLIILNALLILATRMYSNQIAQYTPLVVSALAFLAFWGTLLTIELAFPVLYPKQFASIVDIRNRFFSRAGQDHVSDLIYDNKFFQNFTHIENKEEIGSRMSWHKPRHLYVYYGYEPNLKRKYENHLIWNSRGYFDKEYSLIKPENIYRIVVIGDSYVESVQVPLDKTFHKIIEKNLNSEIDKTALTGFEVIALGSSGAGQKKNFVTLSTEALIYSPDMVIVTLCSNDVCDDDPQLKSESDLLSNTVTPMTRNLMYHGYFALAFATKTFQDVRRNETLTSPELLQWTKSDQKEISVAWQNTLSTIKSSREFCHDRGIIFLLTYVGSDVEVKYAIDPRKTEEAIRSMGSGYANLQWDFEKTLRMVRSYCSENDIAFISLQEPLTVAQRKTGLSVFGDHYSFFGHEIASKILLCAIRNLVAPQAETRGKNIEELCHKEFKSDF